MARWQLSAWPTPLLTLLQLTVCVYVFLYVQSTLHVLGPSGAQGRESWALLLCYKIPLRMKSWFLQ